MSALQNEDFFFSLYKLDQVRNLSFLGKKKNTSLVFTEELFWYNLSCFTPTVSIVVMLNTYSVVCSSHTYVKFSKMWIYVWTKILFILTEEVGSRSHSWFYPEFSWACLQRKWYLLRFQHLSRFSLVLRAQHCLGQKEHISSWLCNLKIIFWGGEKSCTLVKIRFLFLLPK